MNWIERLRVFFRGDELPVSMTGRTSLIPLPGPNVDITPISTRQEKLSAYLGWIYAAASTISWDVRATRWTVYRVRGKSREDWVEIPRKDLPGTLKRPNSLQLFGELIELTQLHLDLAGLAWWNLITDTPGGPIQGIQVIPPHWVDEPAFTDTVPKRLKGWKVTVPGSTQVTLRNDDLVWFRYAHPMDPLDGASPVEAFAVSHDLDIYARAYGASLMKNQAMPAGLLTSDQDITPQDADLLRERWKDRHQGRTEIGILGKGAKYQTIGLPLKDLQFLEITNLTRDQIFACYKIPASKLGISKDVNRTDSEAHERSYQKDALRPRLRRLAEPINMILPRLFPRTREELRFEFEDPVDVDREYELLKSEKMLSAGAITVNQYLARLNEPSQEDGDVYLVPNTVTRIPAGMLASAPQPAPQPASRGLPQARNGPRDPGGGLEEDAVSASRGSHFLESDLHELVELRFLQRQERQERILRSEVRALFSAEQKRMLRALRANLGKSRDPDDASRAILPEPGWIGNTIAEGTAEWETTFVSRTYKAVQDGVVLMGLEIPETKNIGFSVYAQEAGVWAKRHAGELITGQIQPTTLAGVKRVIRQGIDEGHSINKISKRVEALYDEFKGLRSEVIARTETAMAINWGKQFSAIQSSRRLKMDIRKKWVTTIDSRERPWHRKLHGVEIPVEDQFVMVGPRGAIARLKQPGDAGAPGWAVIQCRCTPVYRKAAESEAAPLPVPDPVPGATTEFIPAKDHKEWGARMGNWFTKIDRFAMSGSQKLPLGEANAILRGAERSLERANIRGIKIFRNFDPRTEPWNENTIAYYRRGAPRPNPSVIGKDEIAFNKRFTHGGYQGDSQERYLKRFAGRRERMLTDGKAGLQARLKVEEGKLSSSQEAVDKWKKKLAESAENPIGPADYYKNKLADAEHVLEAQKREVAAVKKAIEEIDAQYEGAAVCKRFGIDDFIFQQTQSKEAALEAVMIHESGHAIQLRDLKSTQAWEKFWNSLPWSDRYKVSEYATSSATEGWAESYAATIQGVDIPDHIRAQVIAELRKLGDVITKELSQCHQRLVSA